MHPANEIIHDMRMECARLRRIATIAKADQCCLYATADKLESMAYIYETNGLLAWSATDAQPAK